MAEGDGQRRDSRPQYRIVSLSYLRNFVKGDASKIDYRKNDRWDIDVSGVVLYHGKEPPRELKQVELNIGDKTLKTSSQANGKFEFAFSVFEVKEFQARIWLTESPGQIVPLVVTTRERTEIEELEERKCLANLRFEVQQAEERLQKREDILASHETTKCHFCGAEVSEDAHHCERCKSVQRKFKRLCPRCMKEVDTKANKCLHCGNNFPLVVGAERFAYILCGNARCERSNTGVEIDDWMADRRLPFLFQAEKGDKIKALPSESPQSAAQLKAKYFSAGHVAVEETTRLLEASDESPWCFASQAHAAAFLANFPCICGHATWKISKAKWFVDKSAPIVKKAAKATGRGLWSLLKGAYNEWRPKK